MGRGLQLGPFAHAVASFEPTENAVLLWTRLSDHAIESDWEIARDPGFDDVVDRGTATTGPDHDHTIVVDVGGLAAGTTYWYRFSAGGTTSPIGRTRTLPAAPVERFRIGLVCCARFSVAPLGVYRAMAEREVDLVVHLGDYIYEDAGGDRGRAVDPGHDVVTVDDYRRRLAQTRADTDTQALHLRHPVMTVWDDHDLADNAWRDGAKHHDPARHGPWGDRVAAAARARQEWLPARLRDRGDPSVIWRSVVVGDLAELVLLDARLTGRDRQAGDGIGPSLKDPARSLLGDEQREWARSRVLDTARPWVVVASSVVVNQLVLPWPRALQKMNRLLPNGYAVIDGEVLHDDQWDGYPVERDRLAGGIRQRGEAGGRTVLVSGDVHSSWAFEGPCDPEDGTVVAVEFTAPAVSSAAMGRAHYPGLWRLLDRAAGAMDHVRWAEVTERGYALVDLTPAAACAEWWFVHPYDDDPTGSSRLEAAFVAPFAPWPPRLERTDVAQPDPARPSLGVLPPRPKDLRRLRARRWARLSAGAARAVALAAGPPALWSWLRHRRRPGEG